MEIDIQLLFISFMLILLPAILSRNYLVPAMVLFSFLTITLPMHYGLSVWIIVSAVISFSLFMLAAFTEMFSFNLDDNFTVGILTGGCLEALIYFQVI